MGVPAKVTIQVVDLPQFQRLLTAVRKIYDHPGTHPNHLGGCIGMLSDPSCQCGLADLRFAVQALVESKSEQSSAQSASNARQ